MQPIASQRDALAQVSSFGSARIGVGGEPFA